MLFDSVAMTVSAISDFYKRDQFDFIKSMVGRLKWIGTDSSVLFCMPCLCSPKYSLRVRPVRPMYCEGGVVPTFS